MSKLTHGSCGSQPKDMQYVIAPFPGTNFNGVMELCAKCGAWRPAPMFAAQFSNREKVMEVVTAWIDGGVMAQA